MSDTSKPSRVDLLYMIREECRVGDGITWSVCESCGKNPRQRSCCVPCLVEMLPADTRDAGRHFAYISRMMSEVYNVARAADERDRKTKGGGE